MCIYCIRTRQVSKYTIQLYRLVYHHRDITSDSFVVRQVPPLRINIKRILLYIYLTYTHTAIPKSLSSAAPWSMLYSGSLCYAPVYTFVSYNLLLVTGGALLLLYTLFPQDCVFVRYIQYYFQRYLSVHPSLCFPIKKMELSKSPLEQKKGHFNPHCEIYV